MNKQAFKTPESIFRGTDFWMLNDRLTEEGIVQQLTDMKAQGVYSFIARTYIGLKSDYPGEDFMHKMSLIIEHSKKLGLKVFIQAGYMPEAVVGLPEDCAIRYIQPVKPGEENGRRILCSHGNYSFVEHNSRTYLDMLNPVAMDYYLKTCYEDMWARFSDEYGKTILSVWVDEPSYMNDFPPFTPIMEALFFERWGYEFAPNAWKLFYDGEDADSLRYHYRVLVRDLLEDSYFKKVRKWCSEHNLLFSGHLMMEETSTSQINRAGACMPYYKYFDIPGIDVLGANMNWADGPIGTTGTTNQYVLYNTAMQCVSAARQAGQEHILAEMYGVIGEDMGFRNLTSMFDSYAAQGINHRSVHGAFYSLRGRGKRAYPPHVHYYQPYWEKYHTITDYCARVSEFISEGFTEGDIAVISPLESAFTMYKSQTDDRRAGGDAAYDHKIYAVLSMLKTIHRDPELCDLATLRDWGRISENRLVVGKMSYKTVILPDLRVITEDFLRLLEGFTNADGRLIVLGKLPELLDGIRTDKAAKSICAMPGVRMVADLNELEALLCDEKALYRLTGRGAKNLLVNRRVVGDGFNFFLYNDDCSRSAFATLEVDGVYKVSICNGYDGSIADYPCECDGKTTKIPVEVVCGGSLMLALEAGGEIGSLSELEPTLTAALDGGWEVVPEHDNTLLLEYWQYRTGEYDSDGEFSCPLPVAAIQRLLTDADYRGPLTLRRTLETKSALTELKLALENPELQSIFIDGREYSNEAVGYFFEKAFETVKIGRLDAGIHTLEIRREFKPLSKFKSSITSLFETQLGVELEPMYLLGDFVVNTFPVKTRCGCVTVANRFTLDKRPERIICDGELSDGLFPFYTGTMKLKKTVKIPSGINEARLRLRVMNAAVGEVYLNGEYCGDINRAPQTVTLKNPKPGENIIELRLFTTLRNIIGPHHRPQGEVGSTFGGGYKNPDAAWLSVDVSRPGWEKNLGEYSAQFTENYNLASLGVEGVTIELK